MHTTAEQGNTHMEHIYTIRVKDKLDLAWAEWFGGLVIRHDSDGNTTLQGSVADQAALHGLINKVHALGLTLLSVTPTEAPDPHPMVVTSEQAKR